MSQRITTAEATLLLLVAALFHFLSSSFSGAGFYVDLMLAATVYIANHSDPARAALLGCMGGLLQDITGLHPMWGLNGFSKTLIGFSSYYLIRYLVVESIAGRGALLFGLSFVDLFVIYSFLFLLEMAVPENAALHAVLKASLTALAGGALFWFLDRWRFPKKDYRHLE